MARVPGCMPVCDRRVADECLHFALLLSFLAVSNKTYAVQYRDAADTGDWLKLADVPMRATNRMEVVPDSSVGTDNRFYRLAILPRDNSPPIK